MIVQLYHQKCEIQPLFDTIRIGMHFEDVWLPKKLELQILFYDIEIYAKVKEHIYLDRY